MEVLKNFLVGLIAVIIAITLMVSPFVLAHYMGIGWIVKSIAIVFLVVASLVLVYQIYEFGKIIRS